MARVTAEFRYQKHRLSYLHQGSGPQRLIWLHGLCGTKDVWSAQISYFAKRFEIYAVDLLNHGQSSPCDAVSATEMNAEILERFLKSLPPQPTVVISHSWAGSVLNLLTNRGTNLAAAVFVDSPCLLNPKRLANYHELGRSLRTQPDPTAFVRSWFGGFLTTPIDPDHERLVVGAALQFSPVWLAEFMAHYPSPKTALFSRPVFVVEGESYFPSGNPFSWASLFAESHHWRYSGGGHFYFLQDPAPFNSALEKFLAETVFRT